MLDILEDFLYVLKDPSGGLAARSALQRHLGVRNKRKAAAALPLEPLDQESEAAIPFFRLDGNVSHTSSPWSPGCQTSCLLFDSFSWCCGLPSCWCLCPE